MILKELIFTVSTLEGCGGGLEISDFSQILLLEAVVVLK